MLCQRGLAAYVDRSKARAKGRGARNTLIPLQIGRDPHRGPHGSRAYQQYTQGSPPPNKKGRFIP